ncbi:Cytochrome P450 71A1 [Linum perenne]
MELPQWSLKLAAGTINPFILVPLLFIIPLFFLVKFRNSKSKLNLPPSPPTLPLIGNLHQVGAVPYRSLKSLADKYGSLMLLHFGSAPTLVVSSAQVAEVITRDHDVVFADRPRLSVANIFFFGWSDLAFCPYGEYWRQVKKICVLELLSQKRVQGFDFVREEETDKLVDEISAASARGEAVDLSELLVSISNNIVSRSALGRTYTKTQDGELSSGDLVRTALGLVGGFCIKDLFPWLGFLDTLRGFNAKVHKASKALHDFLDKVIEEHEAANKKGSSNVSSVDRKDIIDILLQLEREGKLGINLTRNNMKAVVMDMFIGGTDTTASTMDWAMAEMMKNPCILNKAQEEVRKVVGKKVKVEESDLDSMSYLKCVIKETLRLHVSGIIPRQTTSAVKVNGYDIPAKTRVLINTWAIQRDPKQWDNPEEFNPERFVGNELDFRGQNKEYLPFGTGRRICPGISYALKEVEYVVANLLYKFDWAVGGGDRGEDMDMTDNFDMVIRRKMPLVLVPTLHYSN